MALLFQRNGATPSDPTTVHIRTTLPSDDDFTSLEAHNEATPATFFGGRPVLHAKATGCDLLLDGYAAGDEVFSVLVPGGEGAAVNGDGVGGSEGWGGRKVVRGVEVWVTSESVLVVNTAKPAAVSVPYPAVSLHATQRLLRTPSEDEAAPRYEPPAEDGVVGEGEVSAVYMQIDTLFASRANVNPDVEDDLAGTLELVVVPQGEGGKEKVMEVFEALSVCADLHPDPEEEGEREEGMMVGGGFEGGAGWITAENANEFQGEGEEVEEEGGEGVEVLGPGAGSRRGREEVNGVDGGEEDEEDEEAKWQRTG